MKAIPAEIEKLEQALTDAHATASYLPKDSPGRERFLKDAEALQQELKVAHYLLEEAKFKCELGELLLQKDWCSK